MGPTAVRYAVRRLRRQPALAAGIVGVVALAIGANTAIFTLVDAVLLRPLPLREPDRLVTFTIVRPGTDRQPLSLPDLADVRAASRTLEAVACAFGWSTSLTGAGEAERFQGMRVSADFFDVTGADVELGRVLHPDDEPRPVALVSHGVWERRFGGSPDALGRRIVLNGEAFTIVGVLRPDFVSLVRDVDVVAPFSPASDPRRSNRAQGFLLAVARLRAGVTLRQAADDLTEIDRRMRAQYPDSHGTDIGVRVMSLHDSVAGEAAPMLRLLLGAVGLVLLVACANVANLFLARGASRRREFAVRTTLGASRARIAADVLLETVLLVGASAAIGLVVARALVDGLLAIAPAGLPRTAEVTLDARVAMFTLALALGAALLCGLGPAIQAARSDLREALASGDRAFADSRGRLRRWLIFAEVALSAVLVLTAALLARSFQRVQAVDPGFQPSHVLSIRLSLPRARYKTAAAIEQFCEQARIRVAALPGIRAVAAANVVPMNGYLATTAFYVDGVLIKNAPEVQYRMISPEYFSAMGIPLRAGRSFTGADHAGAAPVAIVNETFARRYLSGRNPVGVRMRLDDGQATPRPVDIVGVVGDVKHFGLERETTIEAYVPIPQVPDPTTIWLANNLYWVVRTDGDPLAAANAVRREIAAVDPTVAASFVRSMDQWMAASVAPRRFNLLLVEAFALAGLLLAVVGVYAMSASDVAARTREIGIRSALGGTHAELMALVVRAAMTPVVLGLIVGLAVAIAAQRALAGLLFGVTPHDPVALAGVAVTLGCAALAATSLPAKRAAGVDPLVALRSE